ncbi:MULTISPECIES: hypothetical protein [unclassified Variovorax]|uniref:hypothetical protein n=1 Tax=unclassified Variovorax TaxID=663243 RepID=UPI00076D1248|nr:MULTISPECIES: hypothetical protein [unclassified Variovorax]KWT94677.1 hypothetical protein APY03_2552 [Variovorax sp. WDL1]PNG53184.1 hypothetical protein CHC06_04529 [Variovorax sp. B2]PNG53756.1 hypothetical protein CHC07_03576 [Variovorax sp. B4]VTV11208.1 hypothetical protein WDL1CHR_02090 [Variovorax sp. WDL1]
MAVFLSRASQQYAARVNPYAVSATIPAGLVNPVRAIKVTISHADGAPWPAGPIAEVTLTGPDGSTQGFTFSGGQEVFRDEKRNFRSCMWEIQEGEPFPPGAYLLAFKVLQTVTAGVLIERF